MTEQVTKQFVVVPAEAVDESQALGRIAFFDADGNPLDVAGGGEAATVAWADVSGKPTEFTPAAHTHTIAEVEGLQDALDAKADAA